MSFFKKLKKIAKVALVPPLPTKAGIKGALKAGLLPPGVPTSFTKAGIRDALLPPGTKLAQDAARQTMQKLRPPGASPTAARRVPDVLRGATASAAPAAAFRPRGNARAEAMRAKMPQHLTAQIRGEGMQRRYGPIVGSRADVATVQSFAGIDGFSFGKLTKWVTSATAAIASKDPAAILSVATAAIPGGKTPPPVPKPPPPPQPTQVEQMFTAMRPQNNTQTMMMVGAGVLGIGLVALLLKRR